MRADGVRISVAESLDAMRAVSAGGLARTRLREALRATLIKDEAGNSSFETLFTTYFDGPGQKPGMPRQSRAAHVGVFGAGSGRAEGATSLRPHTNPELPTARSASPSRSRLDAIALDSSEQSSQKRTEQQPRDDSEGSGERAARAGAAASADARGGNAPPHADALQRLPFAHYSTVDYATARDVLALLQRRLRVRLGRRLRFAQRGRIDFRRTIRAAIQHG
ncbi:MAG: hypothetical protein ACREQC_15395, partial [Candidatus Binataceae bacterium]